MKTWIQTYSGKKLDLLNPDPDAIVLEDIAHALAATNRFNGHTFAPYSVAEHSVLVSYEADSDFARPALMHDFVEYAIGDIVSPMKRALGEHGIKRLAEIEKGLNDAFALRFGFFDPSNPEVVRADLAVLAAEQKALFPVMAEDWGLKVPASTKVSIKCWDHKDAKWQLLHRANELGIR